MFVLVDENQIQHLVTSNNFILNSHKLIYNYGKRINGT